MLIIITFYTSIQYIFLAGVPESVSGFAFIFITSLVGFIILLCVFFNELFRVDKTYFFQCLILAIEIFLFNVFLLFGVDGVEVTTVSGIVSSYFIFLPLIEFILYKTKPQLNTILAIVLALFGVYMIIGFDVKSFLNKNIIFLLLADISMALYIITTGEYARNANPAIISMGQLLFVSIFSFISWIIEARIKGVNIVITKEPLFWGSVIFIGFFIRGLYTVIQVYAQRFVSNINVSLVFASEIIMTLFFSNHISEFFGYEYVKSEITVIKCIGVILMIFAICICDSGIFNIIFKRIRTKYDNSASNNS